MLISQGSLALRTQNSHIYCVCNHKTEDRADLFYSNHQNTNTITITLKTTTNPIYIIAHLRLIGHK